MRDAETGQRGFLLTLNESYLKPFHDGIENAVSVFENLKSLTQDNVVQQTRLVHVYGFMNQKISELEKTVQLAKQDKFTEAMTIVKRGEGKNVMDNLRGQIREFISEEERLLKLRKVYYLEHKSNLKLIFALEAILLIALIIIAGFLIQKTLVRPLVLMKNFIAEDGDINDIGIIIKTSHNEIGILAEAFKKMHREVKERTKEKDNLISELQNALNEVETLKGTIPICSYCHKIRDDEGAWNQLEKYLSEHSAAQFSHGICPNCIIKARADIYNIKE